MHAFQQSKIEDAAERRVKAQSQKKHFEGKLAEEEDKVKQVEAVVKVLQEEFTVCVVCHACLNANAARFCSRAELD